jgi:hypothetical protein
MRTANQVVADRAPRFPSAQKSSNSLPSAQRAPWQALQQSIGNARLAAMLQPKLSVSQPDDVYEQEADRVADTVLRLPEPADGISPTSAPHVQRLCAECEEGLQRQAPKEKDEEPLQTKSETDGTPAVSPEVEDAIHALPGRGSPLPESVRSFMEPRFSTDFSAVRLHTDAHAHDLARAVDAQAFTVGRDIVFGANHYAPESERGKHLLAHELTHVVQQRGASAACANVQRKIGDGHDLTSPRFGGDVVLEACYDDERYLQWGDRGPAVEKIQQALLDAGYPFPLFGVDGSFKGETKRAVIMFQKTAGLSGADVDGIIGPVTMGLLDTRVGSTPAKWAEYITDGLAKLAVTPPGFPGAVWRYDSNYWQEVTDPEYVAYEPKSGVTPSEAIDALFDHLDLWDLDCALFPEVAQLYAYRHALGDAAFDLDFSNLRLRQHQSTGIAREFYDVDDIGAARFNRIWDSTPVGTKVMWTNRSLVTVGTAWHHENAIKSFKAADPKNDRYDAHPLGSNLLEKEVKKGLAENASDYPSSGSADEQKTYVRDNVYRHQLHLILFP